MGQRYGEENEFFITIYLLLKLVISDPECFITKLVTALIDVGWFVLFYLLIFFGGARKSGENVLNNKKHEKKIRFTTGIYMN